MKRSSALAPLSRDHHHALVVAQRLSRATEEDAAPATEAFVAFLSGHELAHFALEESVLLPLVAGDGPGEQMAARIRADHAALREDLERLRNTGGTGAKSTDLHTVGERLRSHVQLEEREFFPYLEQMLDESALADLAQKLSVATGGLGEP